MTNKNKIVLSALVTSVGFFLSVFFSLGVCAAELIMLESDSCPWCEAWNNEIGPYYHKTPEGKRAPLRKINVYAPLPKDLTFLQHTGWTPTFILVENKQQIGQIMGYPGEDHFWGLLGLLMKKLSPPFIPPQ